MLRFIGIAWFLFGARFGTILVGGLDAIVRWTLGRVWIRARGIGGGRIRVGGCSLKHFGGGGRIHLNLGFECRCLIEGLLFTVTFHVSGGGVSGVIVTYQLLLSFLVGNFA